MRAVSDARAIRRLRREFGKALREARHRSSQLFLEIFAGHGGVSSALKARGYGALGFEITLGDHFDVCRAATFRLIKGWLRAHCVCGVWLGTPCTTWPRARRGPPGSHWAPVRTEAHTLGLSGLSVIDQQKVRLGNQTAAVSIQIIQLCVALKIPAILENPQSSLLWKHKPMARLLRHSSGSNVDVTMCAFGAPWLKATKIAMWNCRPPNAPPMCHARGVGCTFSSRPHIVLSGRDPATNTLWTRRAQRYPADFSAWGADILWRSAEFWALRNATRIAVSAGLRPVP